MNLSTKSLVKITDGTPVRVFLPLKKSPALYRAQCVYKKNSDSKINLLFKIGVLPADDIATKQACFLNIDIGGKTMSVEAKIEKVENDQSLEIVVNKTVTHDEMRQFFRVDATTRIISRSFHTEIFGTANEPWSIEGKTIDISGNGVLAIFPSPPPEDKQVRLEITIPLEDKTENITVLAHQVRSTKLNDNHFETAFHFDDITTENRDKIIGCCLMIQRKLLRLKVKVKDK